METKREYENAHKNFILLKIYVEGANAKKKSTYKTNSKKKKYHNYTLVIQSVVKICI